MITDIDSTFSRGQPWPPNDEAVKTYRDLCERNLTLWDGDHWAVFKDRWIKLFREDETSYEMDLNWPRRISNLFADMLLGESPGFQVPDEQKETLKTMLADDTNQSFIVKAFEVAIDMSRFGIGIFKVRTSGKIPVIESQRPDLWIPVVSPFNIKEATAHILAFTYSEGKTALLRAEIHTKGHVSTRTWLLVDDGTKLGVEIDDPVHHVEIDTNYPDFLVFTAISGQTSTSFYGKDDYSDIACIIAELEVRYAQNNRVLDKNADPTLIGPFSAIKTRANGEQYVETFGGKYIGVASKDDPVPAYITWDGSLGANFTQIEKLKQEFYSLSETSPAAFGILEAGLATSGSALKRLNAALLAKVNRMKRALVPAMKGALMAASALAVQNKIPGAVLITSDLTIALKDGIPDDMKESVDIESVAVGAKLTSKAAAMKRLYEMDDEQVQELMDQIDSETKAAAPPPVQNPDQTGVDIAMKAFGALQNKNLQDDAPVQ